MSPHPGRVVAQLESLEWPLDAATATYMVQRFRSGRTHSVAMAALVPAIHASMPEDVDARVKLRTSGMRVIVKRAPPEDAR